MSASGYFSANLRILRHKKNTLFALRDFFITRNPHFSDNEMVLRKCVIERFWLINKGRVSDHDREVG